MAQPSLRAVAILACLVPAALAGCGSSAQSAHRADTDAKVGYASFYAHRFHGRATAYGETYDEKALTAAHPSLPLGTRIRVTNLANGRSVVLRINDRGPFVGGRALDVSRGAARALGMLGSGTARVRITPLATTGQTRIAPRTGGAPQGTQRSGARRVLRRRRRHSRATEPSRKRSER